MIYEEHNKLYDEWIEEYNVLNKLAKMTILEKGQYKIYHKLRKRLKQK